MASLALALLVLFTNLRLGALRKYRQSVGRLGWGTVVGALPDLGLAMFTGVAVLVMAPLCFETFSIGEIGRRSGAVASMFALIWLGFVAVLIVQLALAVIRLYEAHEAGN